MNRTATAPAAARTAIPAPVHLYYSRVRAAFVLVLNVALAFWLGYVALAGLLSGYLFLLAAGAIGLLVVSPFLAMYVLESLRALTAKDAVVTLDATGVTDIRKKDAFLSWEEVGQVSLGYLSQVHSYLIFEFRNADVARARKQSRPRFLFRKALYLGDWDVNLRPLKCNTAEVLRAAKRLHQYALHQRVISRNGPSSCGWTGTL